MEPEFHQTVPDYSKNLKTDKVEVTEKLVQQMLNEVPEYNPDFFNHFYADWDAKELEVNRLAKILYNCNKVEKRHEMVRRVAAFRSLFLRKYQRNLIPHDGTPEEVEAEFKRLCGWKVLAREAVTVRQEDIDMLTEEWFLLYEKYFLRNEQGEE